PKNVRHHGHDPLRRDDHAPALHGHDADQNGSALAIQPEILHLPARVQCEFMICPRRLRLRIHSTRKKCKAASGITPSPAAQTPPPASQNSRTDRNSHTPDSATPHPPRRQSTWQSSSPSPDPRSCTPPPPPGLMFPPKPPRSSLPSHQCKAPPSPARTGPRKTQQSA